MLPLALAAKYKGKEGAPLPCPFPSLSIAPFRRGQEAMIVAPPGGGKTAFMTSYVLALAKTGIHVLFMSADSDRGTVSNRVGAALTGWEVDDAEKALASADPKVWKMIADATAHIGYCFDPSPTPESIQREIMCYSVVHGKYPDMVVVDNLLDVEGDSDGFDGLAETCRWLKTLASETSAAVVVLHHANGTSTGGQEPIPLSGIFGQVTKPQRLILTLRINEYGDKMTVSVVKNSNGPADPSGIRVTADIDIDLSRMFFSKR